ncbi:hypothetical protein [Anaerobium acetethylicum]|uniref:hypothetical protein n=1 Tax=Anaerobium acetethylicum TaxID=1619234 RepID=UPI001A9A3338|nr:hypothetical protein [Anaerobium acetethylicum]
MSVKEDKTDVVYKLETNLDTQNLINGIFDEATNELAGKTNVSFDGSYTPLEDETLCIANFVLPDVLKDAFRNPISIDSFQPTDETIENIKGICVGYSENTEKSEKFIGAFQRFRKEQYISTSKLNLLFNDGTFTQNKSVGISVSYSIDCFLNGTNLIFDSFYYARQIFDSAGYYRTATDEDINNFLLTEKINLGDGREQVMAKANSWVRRKVALINDSGVLDKYSAMEIKRIAKKHSGLVDLTVKDKMIEFPNDFEKVKVLLTFLDEGSWVGSFSNDTFISTSKRKVK